MVVRQVRGLLVWGRYSVKIENCKAEFCSAQEKDIFMRIDLIFYKNLRYNNLTKHRINDTNQEKTKYNP